MTSSFAWLFPVVLTATLIGCAGPGQEECEEAEYPEALGSETADQLREKYQATDVLQFESGGAAFQALVFLECGTDYKVVFYKKTGPGFTLLGGPHNLLGFEQPRLDTQGEPTIRTRHQESGEAMYFQVTAENVELLPEEGEWESVSPGVEALSPSTELR